MGYITEMLTTITTALIGRQVYDSGPRLSAWLIKKSARRLPVVSDRKLREEEWLAHLNDEPGLAGLYHAAGSLLASYRMLLPFETMAIRAGLWLICRCYEVLIKFFIMIPHSKRAEASVPFATKSELDKAFDFICKTAAQCVIIKLARAHLPQVEVDRAMWHDAFSEFQSMVKALLCPI